MTGENAPPLPGWQVDPRTCVFPNCPFCAPRIAPLDTDEPWIERGTN